MRSCIFYVASSQLHKCVHPLFAEARADSPEEDVFQIQALWARLYEIHHIPPSNSAEFNLCYNWPPRASHLRCLSHFLLQTNKSVEFRESPPNLLPKYSMPCTTMAHNCFPLVWRLDTDNKNTLCCKTPCSTRQQDPMTAVLELTSWWPLPFGKAQSNTELGSCTL